MFVYARACRLKFFKHVFFFTFFRFSNFCSILQFKLKDIFLDFLFQFSLIFIFFIFFYFQFFSSGLYFSVIFWRFSIRQFFSSIYLLISPLNICLIVSVDKISIRKQNHLYEKTCKKTLVFILWFSITDWLHWEKKSTYCAIHFFTQCTLDIMTKFKKSPQIWNFEMIFCCCLFRV